MLTRGVMFSAEPGHVTAQLLLHFHLDNTNVSFVFFQWLTKVNGNAPASPILFRCRAEVFCFLFLCVFKSSEIQGGGRRPLTLRASIPPGTPCQVTDRGSRELLSLVSTPYWKTCW